MKHKLPSSVSLTVVDRPRSVWSIDPYCAHIFPGSSSGDFLSIMTCAEHLVWLVLHLYISKVLNPPAPPLLVCINDKYTISNVNLLLISKHSY
jgi:hypothetical protein